MTTLLRHQVSLLLSRTRCAAQNFSRMDSISGLLSVTTVAAIVISHPLATKALAAQEIAHRTMPTAVQLDNPLASSSGVSIEPGRINIFVLVSREEDPPSPRPAPPGGSR